MRVGGLGCVGMIIESQIRFWLARVITREVSLDAFEDWFVAQSWNMHEDSEEDAQRLVGAVELRLAEYSSGHLNEAELLEELRPYASIYVNPAAPQREGSTTQANASNALSGADYYSISMPGGGPKPIWPGNTIC